MLVWVVFVTARSATLLFANVDPYNALFTFWYEEASLPAMMILGVTLLGSLFIERPWCKYACPYGALLGLFNKIRIFKIRRAPSTCIACNRCTNVCPMNIDVARTGNRDRPAVHQLPGVHVGARMPRGRYRGNVAAAETRRGGRTGGRTMKIKLWMLALLIFVVIFGGIGLTMLTGDWATESDKIPAKFTTGESAGEYNPEDIRGSYTFQDVASAFDIELSVLYDAFGIPAGTDGTAIKTKDIEAVYGDAEIGNGSVQVFVALYKNLPVTLNETYLPKRAAEIILEVKPKPDTGAEGLSHALPD